MAGTLNKRVLDLNLNLIIKMLPQTAIPPLSASTRPSKTSIRPFKGVSKGRAGRKEFAVFRSQNL